ncbi:hypothetical protein G3I77_20115 [Streptomyces sp. D2-8]|uniref:hypothetical protein n=1 Tax=Streptomyces sp. D2-8 TaxID=2707767 RepID=UPI0020C10897|nr:hypothetical protein [Streptomyces sp. D2-8]MCK8435237.1 hypothetical protein [Streptomyces sp. D2-8]
MTWSAALPDAALRTLRTAAGRRALQVALLLGGLLVIGLLWGERAHAENGVGALPESRAGQGVDRLVRGAGGAGEAVSEGLAESRVKVSSPAPPLSSSRSQSPERPSHVEQPKQPEQPDLPKLPKQPDLPKLPKQPDLPKQPELRELSKPSSHPVLPGLPTLPDLPVPADLPTLPSLPGLPEAPALPTLPGLPDPPALPGLPDLPAPPGSDIALPGAPALPTLPGLPSPPALPSRPLPTPVTADPRPDGTTAPTDGTGSPRQAGTPDLLVHGNKPHAAHTGPILPDSHTHHVRHADHLGHLSHFGHPGHPAHLGHPDPSTHTARTPAAHAPGGRPGGALGNRSLADSGSSRHGDVHAVTASLRAPLTLVPGAAARAHVVGTRGGHRDIHLFPG